MGSLTHSSASASAAPATTDAVEDVVLAAAQADVDRARERVAQSVMALRYEVARRGDWREWVRHHPLPFVLGALAVGLWLGRLTD